MCQVAVNQMTGQLSIIRLASGSKEPIAADAGRVHTLSRETDAATVARSVSAASYGVAA